MTVILQGAFTVRVQQENKFKSAYHCALLSKYLRGLNEDVSVTSEGMNVVKNSKLILK